MCYRYRWIGASCTRQSRLQAVRSNSEDELQSRRLSSLIDQKENIAAIALVALLGLQFAKNKRLRNTKSSETAAPRPCPQGRGRRWLIEAWPAFAQPQRFKSIRDQALRQIRPRGSSQTHTALQLRSEPTMTFSSFKLVQDLSVLDLRGTISPRRCSQASQKTSDEREISGTGSSLELAMSSPGLSSTRYGDMM